MYLSSIYHLYDLSIIYSSFIHRLYDLSIIYCYPFHSYYFHNADICRCEVLYDYQGQQADELSIVPGDSIFVTEKIDEDWWQGNLNGVIGIFPANYVEEVEKYD